MERILDFYDSQYFQDCLNDQDPLMVSVVVHRCTSVTPNDDYAGDRPTVTRRTIHTRAEVKPVTLGEIDKSGGLLVLGDLEIRIGVEVRGIQQETVSITDPENVADIITLGIPFQGNWYVVGVPEPGELVNGLRPLFYQANIRRIKVGGTGR